MFYRCYSKLYSRSYIYIIAFKLIINMYTRYTPIHNRNRQSTNINECIGRKLNLNFAPKFFFLFRKIAKLHVRQFLYNDLVPIDDNHKFTSLQPRNRKFIDHRYSFQFISVSIRTQPFTSDPSEMSSLHKHLTILCSAILWQVYCRDSSTDVRDCWCLRWNHMFGPPIDIHCRCLSHLHTMSSISDILFPIYPFACSTDRNPLPRHSNCCCRDTNRILCIFVAYMEG